MTQYAHTLPPPAGREKWEPLEDHLQRVAELAAEFASAFGAEEWGRLAGAWHDLGKYSERFQSYLKATADPDAAENEDNPGRVDHSTFGAQHAAKVFADLGQPHFGQLLAFCIAGHHGNLPDAVSSDATTSGSTLHARLKAGPPRVPPVQLPPGQPQPAKLRLPFVPTPDIAGFQIAFFTRMLFSALIDADRTATEEFCNSTQAAERSQVKPSLADLRVTFDAFMDRLDTAADPTPVNRLRANVLSDCFAAAERPPGFFSLKVPTGGGKTYASLAFALEHALAHSQTHGFRRVVVAIPFTSIIEQTADVYRSALGSLAELGLIEHHSNIDPKKHTRRNQLAAENWDAPLIVTTNVQLYESLFAARTTPCRKLHRLAKSVIVLDEAQTIPVELLRPTLLALKQLVAHYGCTVVLCTATQPALERRGNEFEIGLEKVCPIVSDVPGLFNALRRVEITRLGVLRDEQLVERLAQEADSALCIVNTRAHAAKLYDALVARRGKAGCYHLSTFMCAQHRRDVLTEIRQRLKDGKPCRLISTQLIEAGVDIDFPAVYRAPAGYDSIAQAAGRCNREGRLEQNGQALLGRVYLFETENPPPPGLQRAAAQCARELADRHADPIAPEAVEAYFRLFYWSQQHQWDKPNVLAALADDFKHKEVQLKFRTAASLYQIIREEQQSILVPYNADARAMRDRLLRSGEADYLLLRDAQRYVVGVFDKMLDKFCENGVVIPHESGLWLLVNDNAFSREKGLSLDAVGIDPMLMVQ
jgi:CRISPR-associated endonuclease/helicase Cas3